MRRWCPAGSGRSSEELAFLRSLVLAFGQKLFKRAWIHAHGLIAQAEKLVPRLRTPRQDHVSGLFVPADKDFFALEAKLRREPHRLAPAVFEQFHGLCHGTPV